MIEADKDIFEQAKPWDLPSVQDDDEVRQQAELPTTNALNRPRNQWKFEAPEEEQEIQPLTAQDIEAIRASAYQEGLLSGHKEGLEKGLAQGQEEGLEAGKTQGHSEGLEAGKSEAKEHIDAQVETMQRLFDEIHQPLAQINDEVKKELVILAVSLAKAVINVEVERNDKVLLKAIEEGIAALPAQEKSYQLELHPDDIAIVHAHFEPEVLKEKNWLLNENLALARGGCKILTVNNAVDVSISRRCENILTQVLFNQGLADDPRAS
jgi:flagellar assembly protein FliH